MQPTLTALCCAFTLVAGAASAEFTKVNKKEEFAALVSGKTLTRPMVRLEVGSDGSISGTGVTWEVSGNWTWRDGYFCRDLFWGGDALGYNCQEVKVKDGRILRFTSDKGAGDSAEFRLRGN